MNGKKKKVKKSNIKATYTTTQWTASARIMKEERKKKNHPYITKT